MKFETEDIEGLAALILVLVVFVMLCLVARHSGSQIPAPVPADDDTTKKGYQVIINHRVLFPTRSAPGR